jgi:PAS domain S-box-containing protein
MFNDADRHSWQRTFVLAIAFATLYVATAFLGYYLSFKPGNFATFWPPSGIYLAGLLLAARTQWAWLIGAASVGNIAFNLLANDTSFAASIAFTFGNALEAVAGALLIQHFIGHRVTLGTPREVVGFVMLGAVAASALSAIVGACTVVIAFDAPFLKSLLLWWLSDAMGVLVIGPLLLVLLGANVRDRVAEIGPRWIELALLLASAAVVTMIEVGTDHALMGASFVVFPWLVWAALRFGSFGAVLAFATIAIVAVATATQLAPTESPGPTLMARTMILQGFLAVAGVTTLILAAIDEERRIATLGRVLDANLLRGVFEGASDAIFLKDPQGRYTMVNDAAARNFQLSPAQIVGRTPGEFLPPEDAARIMAQDRQVAASGERMAREQTIDTPTGARTFHTTQSPLRDASGVTVGVIGIARDVTDQRRAERAREAALREKTTLLNEVHHRVKNNLQVISSLLKLQASSSANPQAKRALDESQGRVSAMALVHQLLYEHQDFARIHLGQYLKRLTELLVESHGVDRRRVALSVEGAEHEFYLDLERAIPCGLAVNELLTNAFKHAFPDERSGTVRVALSEPLPGRVSILVSDTGVGLASEIEWGAATTLGLQLVPLLMGQIQGRVTRRPGPGASFELSIAIDEHPA